MQTRPEVLEVHKAYCAAVGMAPRRLGAYKRDRGVQAICALYALGYDTNTLLGIVAMAPRDGWLMGKERGQSGRPLDISALTPAKAGELLAIVEDSKRAAERAVKRRNEALEREREARRELDEAAKQPRPAPVDLGAMIARLANGEKPKPTPMPAHSEVRPSVTARKLTAEELDAILEAEDRKKAGNA